MRQLQQTVVSFFTNVLSQDLHTLEEINLFQSEQFSVDSSNALVFKLSALHQFLCDIDTVNYAEFKKLIYQSDINEQLSRLGGKIEVYKSTGKIDNNIYKLVKV